jgi:hypothetical protein
MDAQDAGALRLVVSCCGQDFADVVVFDFAQGKKLVSGGGDVVVGGRFGRGLARVANVIANFFGEGIDVDVAFGARIMVRSRRS